MPELQGCHQNGRVVNSISIIRNSRGGIRTAPHIEIVLFRGFANDYLTNPVSKHKLCLLPSLQSSHSTRHHMCGIGSRCSSFVSEFEPFCGDAQFSGQMAFSV